MEILIGVLIVAVLILTGLLVLSRRSPSAKGVSDSLKTEFQTLSQTALKSASEQFLRLADERFNRLSDAGSHDLLEKKELIDQQLQNMKGELTKVTNLVQTLEKAREAKFGELTTGN